jgi:3-deoxy-manno-octulosonate cytidylyltransferase (CMP-KDO synthetase)
MAATILIVEDDAGFRDLLSTILDGAGYSVTTAADGGEGLRRIADSFTSNEVQMATLSFPLRSDDENNPNVVKLVTDANDDALYFSRSLLPYPRSREGFAPRKHIGVYGYRRNTLLQLLELPACDLEKIESLEQLRALYHGIKIRVVPAVRDSIGVDTHEDLERVRSELIKRGKAV